MKKVILLTAALILSYSVSFGQATGASAGSGGASANGADKNFHFGLNITPGYYWLSAAAPNAANSGALGFGFGVNLEFYFTQNYGFCTGLELQSIGANYTNTTSYSKVLDSNTAHKYSLRYLEIPLMLKFRTLPIGFMKYFGIVGLNPGIRIKALDNYTVTGGVNGNGSYSEDNVDVSSSTSIIRLSYVIGAGLEYNLAGTTSIQGCISYDSDFINMISGSNSITNSGIKLTIGILF